MTFVSCIWHSEAEVHIKTSFACRSSGCGQDPESPVYRHENSQANSHSCNLPENARVLLIKVCSFLFGSVWELIEIKLL